MIKLSRLVHGVGSRESKYPTKKDGKFVKEYDLWKSMLLRCTEEHLVRHPTYIGTACSENFKSYTFFYEWCQEQIGFKNIDANGKCWQLDKDILVKGNKLYSEDTCVFVPQRVNKLLIKRSNSRGVCTIGVCNREGDKKFQSYCNGGKGKQQYLGLFSTPQEAFLAYKTFKEALIKEVANEYKDQLDPRAYQALINYEVNEND